MRVLISSCVLLLCGVSALACNRTDELSSASAQAIQQAFQTFGAVSDASARNPIAPATRFDVAGFSATQFDALAAQEMLRLVNQARTQAGAAPLVWDDALSLAAQAHGREMLEHSELSHEFPGELDLEARFGQTGLHFNHAGENVAFDFSAQHAHQSLMSSQEHRRNLLDPSFNAVGIAVAWVACQMYVTEDFAQRLPSYGAGQAEDLVAAKVAALRGQTLLPQLNRIKSSDLNGTACSGDQRTQARIAPSLTSARYVLSYSNAEPQALPQSVNSVISNGRMKNFSVGACYSRTEQHPNGAYFVTMMFF